MAVTRRVVGAGLGRTGTSSLKLALERLLGGRCHDMSEVLGDPERQLPLWAPILRGEEVDWEEVFDGYVAQVDGRCLKPMDSRSSWCHPEEGDFLGHGTFGLVASCSDRRP